MSLSRAEAKVGPSLAPRTILIVGLVILAGYIVGIMLAAGTYDSLVAVIVGPALFVLSLPVLARQATREGDGRVFWFLAIALAVKLLGAIGQIYLIFNSYGGVADATGYFDAGARLATRFRAWDFSTGLHPIVGTNFIKIVTGVVLSIIGPSWTGGFLVFSWLGFWGLFLFYRAFRIAVPSGRAFTYGRLLFFLPSLIYWPSAIGKDAWMLLGLGIIAFGSARALTGHLWRGLAIAGIGFWMDLMVRPHVVAIAGLALVAGYLALPRRSELGVLAPVVKALSAVLVVGVAVLLVHKSDTFLRESGIAQPTNLNSTLNSLQNTTAIGGSNFQPSPATNPTHVPGAILTVLFRPTLAEAHNFQSTLAALEGTFLLLLGLLRIRWIISAIRNVRRQAYVAMAMACTGLFVVAFSSIANFGILVRQRASVLPFFLVLLSIPPTRKLFSDGKEPAPAVEALPHG
jgi:hypothetical protein